MDIEVHEHRGHGMKVRSDMNVFGMVILLCAAGILTSCSDESSPSACDPNSPDYVREIASVQTDGADVVALDEIGRPVWRRTLNGTVDDAVLLDLSESISSCPPAKRVICGTKHALESSTPAEIVVFDQEGTRLWQHAVTNASPYENGHTDKYNILDIGVGPVNLAADELEYRIIAVASDRTWFPNVIVALDLEGNEIDHYWHPGDLGHLTIVDMDGTDPTELVFCGMNNDMAHVWMPCMEGIIPGSGHYCGVVGVLESDKIWGQAVPYGGGGVKHAYERWYAFAYDTTAVILDIKAHTNLDWYLYIDCSGDSIIGASPGDDATPCCPRIVILKGYFYTWYYDSRCPWGSVSSGEIMGAHEVFNSVAEGELRLPFGTKESMSKA